MQGRTEGDRRADLFRVNPQAKVRAGSSQILRSCATGWASVARMTLTPAARCRLQPRVSDVSRAFRPAVAAGVGLRVPVAQGLMSFTWMMRAIAEGGLPERFALAATFRRPVFWDETVEVLRRGARARSRRR
jgi:hypothetical protein